MNDKVNNPNFVNQQNQLVYDDANKTIYLPKGFVNNAEGQSYIGYLKQRYPGYTIR